ncbi:MAG: ribonuclease E/G, partial [Gammaproteobacteria bacterium]|nr:ribonuclease E/G [Gammaproteobacteria bacterium]
AIKGAVVSRPAPFLIFQDSNAVIRALRDHMSNDVGEIIIDDEGVHEEARQFVERIMPQNLRKLRFYQDPVPLFTRFQIESQIESAFSHVVTLPAGGSLVIEQTEALVSIDINSARATKGEDIESTALATNLEAADEVARQCRLRDLGGLLVVDFIDMSSQRNQREVENRLRDAMKMDRARVQIGRISRFGLLELSRQRLRPSLGESAHQTCPRCNGSGSIRGVESLALAVLRLVGEEARKDRSSKVIAQLPVDVATYLLNEKRDWIRAIEERDQVQLVLIANPHLETPHYTIRRVRDDQVGAPENTGASYTLAAQEQPATDAALDLFAPRVTPDEPAVVPPMPPAPMPTSVESATSAHGDRPAAPVLGLIPRLKLWLFGSGETAAAPAAEEPRRGQRSRRQDGGRQRDQHGRTRRDDRQRDEQRGGRSQGGSERREGRSERGSRNGQRPQRPQGQEARGDTRANPQQQPGAESPREERREERRNAQVQQGGNGGAPRTAEQGEGARRSRPRRRGGRGNRNANGEQRQEQEAGAVGAAGAAGAGEHASIIEAATAMQQHPAARDAAATEHARPPTEAAPAQPAPAPVERPLPVAASQDAGPRQPAQLPWESSSGSTTRSYTVWSSGTDAGDAGSRDRE